MNGNCPVASLLERPGSVEPPVESVNEVHDHPTYLDLPVDLPMLAPVHVQRSQSLFGLYEEDNREASKVRRESHLSQVLVGDAIAALEKTANDGFHDLNSFKKALTLMLTESIVPDSSVNELFESLGPVEGRVDLRSTTSAIILLSKGSADEKIRAIFTLADTDKDGSLSLEELFEFFLLIFGNVMSRSVLGLMNANGVPLSSAEKLAAATAKECLEMCDLDRNGCLSLEEFRNWFARPRKVPLTLG